MDTLDNMISDELKRRINKKIYYVEDGIPVMLPNPAKGFKEISKNYHKIQGKVLSAYYKVLQNYYYPRCQGKSVLDIANGGRHPLEIFGKIKPSYFVGLDSSMDMLKCGKGYDRICADSLDIPFNDETFDYVTMQGMIHHIGGESFNNYSERVIRLLKECLRVCKKEIIITEITTSRYFEIVERVISKIEGRMNILVPSSFMLEGFIKQCNVKVEELRIKTLSELTSPFYWYLIFLKAHWLKFPAFINPFRTYFFVIKK